MRLHLVHLHPVCPGDNNSDWVKHWVKGGHNYYYNLNTKEGTWVEPEDFLQNNTQLNKEDIQVGSSTCATLMAFLLRNGKSVCIPRLSPLFCLLKSFGIILALGFSCSQNVYHTV